MNDSRFDELTQKYLLDTLTDSEAEELSALLTPDEAVAERRRFLRALRMDSHLAEASLGFEPGESDPQPERRSVVVPAPWLVWSAIAAMLMIGVFLWRGGTPDQSAVARIIHIEGEAGVGERRGLATGDELFAGDELTMEAGLIELAYRESGVHVLATAPLSAKLESTMRVHLNEGEMKLMVPPQGVGFVVDTPERKITDLGTSFVVKASEAGSRVLVLDGKIAVNGEDDGDAQLMEKGDLAKFDRDGKIHLAAARHAGIPERTQTMLNPGLDSLRGRILGFQGSPAIPRMRQKEDVIARQILPLVESGFGDLQCLDVLKHGTELRFPGIAGSYETFPDRAGLAPYSREFGWMAWYRGQVAPPKPGRYRFWGYADNHLLVAIDGKPVFEGSRRDSPFKELGIPRTDHPSYPCLNAMAGFACGSWFEVGSEGARLDIMFGEIMNNLTSGLLLVEREGEAYEESYWGQPRWSLFLTEPPTKDEIAELENLRKQMEAKMMGSFSIPSESVWRVSVKL